MSKLHPHNYTLIIILNKILYIHSVNRLNILNKNDINKIINQKPSVINIKIRIVILINNHQR